MILRLGPMCFIFNDHSVLQSNGSCSYRDWGHVDRPTHYAKWSLAVAHDVDRVFCRQMTAVNRVVELALLAVSTELSGADAFRLITSRRLNLSVSTKPQDFQGTYPNLKS